MARLSSRCVLFWRRRLPRSCGPVRSVPAIAVAGSTRRRSLLEAAEQTSTKMRCRWVRRAMARPKSRSSGSIGSRGCQGPLDVGSGRGPEARAGRTAGDQSTSRAAEPPAQWKRRKRVAEIVLRPRPVERQRVGQARYFAALIERVRFAIDSLLEGDGFELSVPLHILTLSAPS